MRYKQFKNANVSVSELTVGTWGADEDCWGKSNEPDIINSIRTAIDHGVTLVDTAPIYGNEKSEKLVGKALKDGYSKKTLVSTKFGVYKEYRPEGLYEYIDSSYNRIMKSCEQSLTNLGIDHIDFFFMHWPDVNTPISESMSALNELQKQGKIRFIGLSNADQTLVEEAEKYGKIDVIQPPYSMVDRRDEAFIKWCNDKGIDSITYGSLGAGILTGAFRKLPEWPSGDARDGSFYDYFQEPKFSKIMQLLGTMDEIAAAHGKPVVQVALNWSTQKDYIGTAICGFRKPARAIQNCKAFDWSLTGEEIAVLDAKLDELGL